MVKRTPLQKRRYLAAFAITALIFVLGFFAGLVLENQRSDFLADAYNQQRVDYSSMQLQHQLIEEIARDEDCAALTKTFEQNINSLESARVRLETFAEDATVKEQEFNLLSREYTHAQIRYYLLAQKTQEICGEDAATILYFYTDSSECSECENQAFVLNYLKRVMQDKLLIFSFNEQLADQEPAIRLLMNRHSITEFPSIVINNEPYGGYQSRDVVQSELCSWYSEDHFFCA